MYCPAYYYSALLCVDGSALISGSVKSIMQILQREASFDLGNFLAYGAPC